MSNPCILKVNDNTPFSHGSRWLRADFHLHTRVDKAFSYNGDSDSDYYLSNYVDALKSAEIGVGVITNHNKFNYQEFKALRKTALKKEVFLLPGVELSVNDGSNGIHTLVVFSDEWLADGQDHINPFLTTAFEGKTPDQYENENGRSSLGLIDTIKKLEGYHKDFFLVFAHVERKSGLWMELEGGRLEELGKNPCFRRRALAFQKVRTHDKPEQKCRVKVQQWLEDAYPAEVEGSDCKSIDQIGRGKPCYLKIGDFSFGAVKYALLDYQNRLADELIEQQHSHILDVSFDGGVLDGQMINLSPELNTLIGIRGSGKSSIVEAIRYGLAIPFGNKSQDTDYKYHLVDHVLGSGGRIIIRAVDSRGQHYEIRRINGEMADVYSDGQHQPGVSIRQTILHKPIYFGQKDLSSTGEGFEHDLVEKLVGENLHGIRSKIDDQCHKVVELVNNINRLSNSDEKKKEYQGKKSDAEFRLKFFKDHGVEAKLQKQLDFDADADKCSSMITFIQPYLADIEQLINQYEDDLNNQRVYTSKQNSDFFDAFFTLYGQLIDAFNQLKKMLFDSHQILSELTVKSKEFQILKESFKDEFAEIERKLSDQLRQSGAKAIRPDEFRQLRKSLGQANQMLKAIDKQEASHTELKQTLLTALAALNDLWRDEYKMIQTALGKVNSHHASLKIRVEFKQDKAAFKAFMQDIFKGSRIREPTYRSLADAFTDFGAMYKNFDAVKFNVGASSPVFESYFSDHLADLLSWQVPNRFVIEYRGKELKHHSLGQRASALILFVLSQQANDLFIIDQPEDDLDNQTIYEDVIKLIRQIKPNTQFIFATHNANIPVLGDAEQIIACSYRDDTVDLMSGSIDCPELQQQVVNIMEGGEEAFNRRKRRYGLWKPQNS